MIDSHASASCLHNESLEVDLSPTGVSSITDVQTIMIAAADARIAALESQLLNAQALIAALKVQNEELKNELDRSRSRNVGHVPPLHHKDVDLGAVTHFMPFAFVRRPPPPPPPPPPPLAPVANSPSSATLASSRQRQSSQDPVKIFHTVSISKAPPQVPASPLNLLYMSLSAQLICVINQLAPAKEMYADNTALDKSVTSDEAHQERRITRSRSFSGVANVSSSQLRIESTSSGSDLADEIRAKISKVLNQIQLASSPVAISSFRPIAVAFQLCLIEYNLLRKIHPNDLLSHRPPNNSAPSLQASFDFFNYFTRVVECSVLAPESPFDRAKTVAKWMKVAFRLRKFNNFQSLKAVICALDTPPVNRLKRTWNLVRKKPEFSELLDCRNLVSEHSNYSAYREWTKDHSTRPMIPFLGVIIHDITYLTSIARRDGLDPAADRRVQDLQKQLRYCTSGPRYSYELLSRVEEELQKEKKYHRRRVVGGTASIATGSLIGLSEQGMEEFTMLKDLNDEEIGTFISHWILSRNWIGEKEIDDLSLAREPRMAPIPTLITHARIPGGSTVSAEQPTRRGMNNTSVFDPDSGQVQAAVDIGQAVADLFPDNSQDADHSEMIPVEFQTESTPGGDSHEDSGQGRQSVTLGPQQIETGSRNVPTLTVRQTSASSGSSSSSRGTSQISTVIAAASALSPPSTRKRGSASTTIMEAIRGTAFSLVQTSKAKANSFVLPPSPSMLASTGSSAHTFQHRLSSARIQALGDVSKDMDTIGADCSTDFGCQSTKNSQSQESDNRSLRPRIGPVKSSSQVDNAAVDYLQEGDFISNPIAIADLTGLRSRQPSEDVALRSELRPLYNDRSTALEQIPVQTHPPLPIHSTDATSLYSSSDGFPGAGSVAAVQQTHSSHRKTGFFGFSSVFLSPNSNSSSLPPPIAKEAFKSKSPAPDRFLNRKASSQDCQNAEDPSETEPDAIAIMTTAAGSGSVSATFQRAGDIETLTEKRPAYFPVGSFRHHQAYVNPPPLPPKPFRNPAVKKEN